MKHKKLIYSNDIMEDFNAFFDSLFKVTEVGAIYTTNNRKDIKCVPCLYDGLALNREDGTVYLRFSNKENEQFILLENETIIVDDDNAFYVTSDSGLHIISKGNIEAELKRLKDFELLMKEKNKANAE